MPGGWRSTMIAVGESALEKPGRTVEWSQARGTWLISRHVPELARVEQSFELLPFGEGECERGIAAQGRALITVDTPDLFRHQRDGASPPLDADCDGWLEGGKPEDANALHAGIGTECRLAHRSEDPTVKRGPRPLDPGASEVQTVVAASAGASARIHGRAGARD